MKRLKTITSYTGKTKFLAETESTMFWMASKYCPVKDAYSYGPTRAIFKHGDRLVWIAETSHKRFEVWQVPPELVRTTEDEAYREQFTNTTELHHHCNPV